MNLSVFNQIWMLQRLKLKKRPSESQGMELIKASESIGSCLIGILGWKWLQGGGRLGMHVPSEWALLGA